MAVIIAATMVATPLAAQSVPIVEISAPSKFVLVDAEVTLSIDWCGPGGEIFSMQRVTLYPIAGGSSVDVTGQFSQGYKWPPPSFCQGPDDYYEHWTGVVTIPEGGAEIWATALNYHNYQGSGGATIKTPLIRREVVVEAEAPGMNVPAGLPATALFTITNNGEVTATFGLSRSCNNLSSCGAISQTQLELNPGQSGTATVSVNASLTPGVSGSVTVTATDTKTASNTGTGGSSVMALGPAAPGVFLVGADDVLERSLCLTVSAGSEIAYECGDLRVVHPLPSVRTMNKSRAPTLVFGSQHANPFPVVSADVAFPSGDPLPTTVQATLTINGTSTSQSWNGSDWLVPGQMRRISLGIDASSWATGLYSYDLTIRRITGGSNVVFQTVSGQLPVVNRIQSPFGAGWWLAGLERLSFPGDGTVFWVGGDGSTRLYRPVAANVWTATQLTRVDSLTFDGTNYQRHLPNNLRVRFNASGLHVATINRLNHQTSFHYRTIAGRAVLDTLTLPVISGTPLRYAFNYNGNGQLTSVDAPGPSAGTSRVTTLTVNTGTGRVEAIQDPDLHSVSFGYDVSATRRITSRTDRRGFATTFGYDAAGRLTSHSLNPGGGAATIAQSYRPIETLGLPGTALGAAQQVDSVFALLNGPRTDVNDLWRFYFTRSGLLELVVNPIRAVTSIAHGDARWPALATQVKSPDGLVMQAFYNERALLDSTKAVNFLGDGRAATMAYEWDAKWDAAVKTTSPTGIVTKLSLNATNGNRLWQQTGPDSTRVVFGYDASTAMLRSITAPGMIPDSSFYDGTLGNLRASKGPNGGIDSVFADAAGRDTLSRSPFDATHKNWTRTTYDAMDRVIRTVTFGPSVQVTSLAASFTAPADSLVVDQEYDNEGNLTRVARSRGVRFPISAPLAATTVYDGAGRKTSETLDGRTQNFTYNPAGQVTAHATGRGTVTSTYDALGQIVKRVVPAIKYASQSCTTYLTAGCGFTLPNFATAAGINEVCIPADTAFFSYDRAGRMTKADNMYARVRRKYRTSGLLIADTLKLRSYYSSGTSPCETLASGDLQNEFGGYPGHSYVLTYTYDLEGRRKSLVHPWGTQTYVYDTASAAPRGLLLETKDIAGRSYTFEYDAAGRRRKTFYPGSVTETLTFGTDGRMSARTVGGVIADALSYDLRDRVVSATNTYRAGATPGGTASTWYGGLGAVIAATNYSNVGESTEAFEVDALGNRTRKQQNGLRPSFHPDELGIRFSTYDSWGRLTTVADTSTGPGDQYSYSANYLYDAGGAVTLTHAQEWDATSNINDEEMSASYYGVDDKLRVFERNAKGAIGRPGQRPMYEEYRYDALGRRVLTRLRATGACNPTSMGLECASRIERVVWDGDQVLMESRADGSDGRTSDQLEQPTSSGEAYGRVIYTHALGLDHPLSVSKDGVAVMPHQNWSGQYDVGTLASGASTRNCTGGSSCPVIDWPGGARSIDGENLDPHTVATWFGNLVSNKTDGSGLQYMRNRYYDPKTGRFTQQDPIGLAGGLNAYGFASGDPVNYADPLGLCPEFITGRPCSAAVAIGVGFVPVLGDAIDIAGALVGRDLMTGEDIGAVGVGVTIAGTFFGSGKLAREGAQNAAPALSRVKAALREVHDEVGKLPKGKPGKFGSPQRGTSKKGYRLDPPHPNAKPGTPEEGWHINWWDWTEGKRGSGGRSNAVKIDP